MKRTLYALEGVPTHCQRIRSFASLECTYISRNTGRIREAGRLEYWGMARGECRNDGSMKLDLRWGLRGKHT